MSAATGRAGRAPTARWMQAGASAGMTGAGCGGCAGLGTGQRAAGCNRMQVDAAHHLSRAVAPQQPSVEGARRVDRMLPRQSRMWRAYGALSEPWQ